jgi:hypothetical protein
MAISLVALLPRTGNHCFIVSLTTLFGCATDCLVFNEVHTFKGKRILPRLRASVPPCPALTRLNGFIQEYTFVAVLLSYSRVPIPTVGGVGFRASQVRFTDVSYITTTTTTGSPLSGAPPVPPQRLSGRRGGLCLKPATALHSSGVVGFLWRAVFLCVFHLFLSPAPTLPPTHHHGRPYELYVRECPRGLLRGVLQKL